MKLALVVCVAVSFGVPGWALLNATGLRTRLDTVACLGAVPVAGLTAWAPALAVGMILGLSFNVVMGALAVASAAGLAVDRGPARAAPRSEIAIAAAAGLTGAMLGTRWQWSFYGDEVFHAGRIRKLLALPHLSLDGVSTYLNGSPHAGYAFPLLHAAQAGAIDLSGIDPTRAYPNLSAGFALMLPVCLFAAGRAIGGLPVGLAAMLLGGYTAVGKFEPSLAMLQWPGVFTFFVLTPVVVLLVAELMRSPDDRRLIGATTAGVCCVAFVHPTYVVPVLAVIVSACVLGRRAWYGLAAAFAGAALILGWIWWVALRGTHEPKPASGQWRVATPRDYVFIHGHAVASTATDIVNGSIPFLFALVALPVLLLWDRRRYALGASLMAGPLVLVAFPGFAAVNLKLMGVGQTHRLPAAIPWTFTAAVGLALIACTKRRLPVFGGLALAVVAAAALLVPSEHFWHHRAWSWIPVTPVAVVVAGITIWYLVRRLRAGVEHPGRAITITMVLTLLVLAPGLAKNAHRLAHDLRHGIPTPRTRPVPAALLPLLKPVAADGHLPVVLGPADLSYRLVGAADVYVVAVPEVRSRAEPKNHPVARRHAVNTFLKPTTPESTRRAIAEHYDVRYVVVSAPGPNPSPTAAQLEVDPLFHRLATIHDGGFTYVVFERGSST